MDDASYGRSKQRKPYNGASRGTNLAGARRKYNVVGGNKKINLSL